MTHGRAALFAAIVNGEMRLSEIGSIADACWREIPNHFTHVELGSFVVTPNHIHGYDPGAKRVTERKPFGAPRIGSVLQAS